MRLNTTKPHAVSRPNESFESLFKRWKRAVDKSNLLRDLRDREFFEKPSVTKKRRMAAAKKRWQRKQAETSGLPAQKQHDK